MSAQVLVVISPATKTMPVVTSVSIATRELKSSRITASRTASETWSAILSGWPSVTDSEVKRYVPVGMDDRLLLFRPGSGSLPGVGIDQSCEDKGVSIRKSTE